MKDAAFYASKSVGKNQPCNHFCCQFAMQEAFRQDVTEGPQNIWHWLSLMLVLMFNKANRSEGLDSHFIAVDVKINILLIIWKCFERNYGPFWGSFWMRHAAVCFSSVITTLSFWFWCPAQYKAFAKNNITWIYNQASFSTLSVLV